MAHAELVAEDPALSDLPARFELEARLGRGGMATVYLARDALTQGPVALKVLHPHLRDEPLIVARFRREIAAARRVEHPAVIRIHDLIETPRLDCLVLEYHPGRDLEQIIRLRGALPVDEALALTEQLLAGLAVAHRAGVVHRDIKPHNLLVDDEGRAKIADFGLARVDDLVSVTSHTMNLGTPEYMAPELLGSPIIDGRADLYGVGVSLFEMLTGSLPFRASTPLALLLLHQAQAPPHIRERDAQLPEWLGAVVKRAMAKAPEDRFATADEMREALRGPSTALQSAPTRERPALRSCPECAAPLLPGTRSCVECGTERVLISERPRGGGRVSIDARTRWFQSTDEINRGDFLTFADKARVVEALTRLGGRIEATEQELDQRLRAPPIILAQDLSPEDGQALAAELRELGLDTVRYRSPKRQLGLNLALGKFVSSLFIGVGLGAFVGVLATSGLVWGVMSVVFVALITSIRAAINGAPLARFDTGQLGQRASANALFEYAKRSFALIRSQRLRQLTRRILARGMELRELLESSERAAPQLLANLDATLTRSLDTAARVAALEAAVERVDVAEVHDRLARLELQGAHAEDVYALDALVEEQARLREQLRDADEHQAEIVRLSGQLLDTSSRLAKLLREHELDGTQSLTSMSRILGDLEAELLAQRELEA